ncbi:MAG: LptF/LptG family permease [Phycisphaerales bacterium]
MELWRLIALASGVTVAVGVFAVTLRPLADGRIGPEEALRFMAFAALPMLQYALPFAAGFAATMAYHRLAADNELVACHAGGISHRAMLVPALVSGLILSGLMLALTDAAIPRLLRGMDEVLSKDVIRLVIAPIKRGEAIQLGPRVQIFADDVASPAREPGATSEQYILSGVLALETDEQGQVVREGSARTAYLWIFRGEAGGARFGSRGTTVVIRLEDAAGNVRGPGYGEFQDTVEYVHHVPEFFTDDPKFHSWAELERMKSRPQMINWIDQRQGALEAMIGEQSLAEAISAALASKGEARFVDGAGRAVTLRAARLGGFVEKGYPIEAARAGAAAPIVISTALEPGGGDGRSRVQTAARAWLTIASGGSDGARAARGPSITIRMEQVSTRTITQGSAGQAVEEPGGELKEWSASGLTWSDRAGAQAATRDTGADAGDQDIDALIARARDEAHRTESPGNAAARQPPMTDAARARLLKSAGDLDLLVADLRREIVSKQQERLAGAAACLVMVLCGAVMAMRLRDSLPLTTYLWSFLPGLAALLTISGGQRLTHQYGMPGLALLWGGVAGLGLYTLLEYRQLARR